MPRMPKGGEGELRYNYSFFNLGADRGVCVQRHAPAALPPGKKPANQRIGGWVGRSGLVQKSRRHRDSIPGLSSP